MPSVKDYNQKYYETRKEKLKERAKLRYYRVSTRPKRVLRCDLTCEDLLSLTTRTCPDCSAVIYYHNPGNKKRADRKNAPCEKCQSERFSFAHRGIRLSKQQRDEIKRGAILDRIPLTKEKLRKARINQIRKNHGLCFPNFNHAACAYFDKINKEFGWNLRHALNGGEIEMGGYFLDAYDEGRNIIVEYDELKHKVDKRREKKDREKESFLMRKLGCQFYRYLEYESRLIPVH